ncbi:acyl-CoA dehydrogenase [Seongchinamella sediminis]|uniref:Acyl-coenzyme A dehydrogenase n=1 Tax=Seongchinamella sediminis TaxID=2283635 RepID=A0A3L7DS46_9GAMM|nr:acyl-CoA dehydrogenase [Seongchinamella sediminis]RLQ20244.1 acyl-CoA dehydrogenase [Seongchinamella sediminis]
MSLLLFLIILTGVFYYRISLILGSLILLASALLLTQYSVGMWIVLLPLAAVILVLNVPGWRRSWLARPVYERLRKAMPPMSKTEREALEAGTTWWEKDLFSGNPDWGKFANIKPPQLTEAEQTYMDVEVENLCKLIDDWDVQQRQDLSPETWDYLRQHGFFGLIIPEEFGGRDFSPYAQSRVMSKIASRSISVAVTAMVPNSLGPGELLVKYGTDEQKKRWLPGLADGTELPCFGLTGPEAGSDAGAIPDLAIVCRGEFEGEEVLGLRLTFSKRWITLAPVATVVGLAFQLRDPEGLLGDPDIVDYGITCALLPADHPGVEIGERHNPGVPFMNGPIMGKDVFFPADWIIGGPEMAGKGWRMLIECLGAGRGVSLPALATASGEMCYLTVGAFARIRRQFNTEIGNFEGVQEVTAEIAAGAYTLEAMRQMVTRGLQDGAPGVLTAMAKYHATERMRELVNHAMDVVSGRAIQLGPRNFMASNYHALPVAITVEGANILTRSLMIFGQGALRCHPYLFDEMQTLEAEDKEQGLAAFEPLLMGHLGHVAGNFARLLVYGITTSRFSPVPADASTFSERWYRRLNQLSCALASCSDVALAVLGGDLKRRELLSARLGDVHSELFIACSILKYHDTSERSPEATAHAEFALGQSLHKAQQALSAFCRNFPTPWLGGLLRVICLPPWNAIATPDDQQIRTLGELIMEPNPVRQALAKMVFVSDDPEDPVGRVETTYQMLLTLDKPWQAVMRARNKGELDADSMESALKEAAQKEIISQEDVAPLLEYDARRFDCLLTDHALQGV